MNATHQPRTGQDLLANMARIPLIIPGTLSERRDSRGKVNGWKLQRWHDGRNETRYVAAGLAERVRVGTEGYAQFMRLAQQYAEAKGQEALHALAAADHSKKKPMRQ